MADLNGYSDAVVLGIDDNEKFLRGVETYLSDAGLTNLEFAHDGVEGLKLADEREPDLILLDIDMPLLDGFEVMKRLRRSGSNSKVIIFSVNNDAESGMMAQTLGASDFIPKSDFFDVDNHPTITYQGKLVFDGDAPTGAEGQLTLLGNTKPVKLEIESFKCITHPFRKKEVCGAQVTGEFNRSDFGLSKYGKGAAGAVKLSIQVEAVIKE